MQLSVAYSCTLCGNYTHCTMNCQPEIEKRAVSDSPLYTHYHIELFETQMETDMVFNIACNAVQVLIYRGLSSFGGIF